jgi:putative transposase
MELQKTTHSIFFPQLSLVLVVKYRREVLTNEIVLGEKHNIEVEDIEHDFDHVHILF